MKTSDVGIAQQAVPVINPRTVNTLDLEAMLDDDGTRWYAERRLRALQAAGLVVTTAAGWNDKLHPRGRDGKFIEKFGFVRWIENGHWQRGQVMSINDDGHVTLRKKDGSTVDIPKPSQQLYSLPRPKGVLNLPGGGSKADDGTWVKTGGQGGSNPGGKFKIMDANAATSVPTEVDDGVVGRLVEDYDISTDWSQWKTAENVLVVIDSGDRDNAKLRVVKRVGNDTDGDPIRLVDAVSGEPIDALELQRDDTATLFINNGPTSIDVTDRLATLSVTPPSNGDEVYVKNSKSELHAANELLANRFYELAGVSVPETFIDSQNPKIFGSKILPSGTPISAAITDADIRKRIQDDIAVDAWLANWDVAGLTLDNITIIDGQPYRIDAGGSMLYRAQGAPKGKLFGPEVVELETLRSKMNPSAKQVFDGVTDEQIRSGVERIAAISPSKISEMVDEANLPPSLADTLIARRDWLMKKYKVEDPDLAALEAPAGGYLYNGIPVGPDGKVTSDWTPGTPPPIGDAPAWVTGITRVYDPALGTWSPQPQGTPPPDTAKSMKSANELVLEQGDLFTGSNAGILTGDTVWLNPDMLSEANELWNGAIPGVAYTVLSKHYDRDYSFSRWKVLNEFTGQPEIIDMPEKAQVNVIGNWGDIEGLYKQYGAAGFMGAVNDSVTEHENLPKLFSVARANAFFETKPFSVDGMTLKLQPGKRTATSMPALFGLSKDNAPKWIAWQSFQGDSANGQSGGFLIDVGIDGNQVVRKSFITGLDGKTEWSEGDVSLATHAETVPMVSTMIELDPYTSMVADAMISRHSVELADPKKSPTPGPNFEALLEPDQIHAEVPQITAPDGTESPIPPVDPPIATKVFGTGVNKWTATEATRDDVLEKLQGMEPTIDPETGQPKPATIQVITYKETTGGQVDYGYGGPGVSTLMIDKNGKLALAGGKYVGTYELNSNVAMKFDVIESDIDLNAIRVREVTYKKDGTVVNKATGATIGTWSNDYYYGYTVKIPAKLSLSGKAVTLRTQQKKDLITYISNITVDPSPKSVVNSAPIKKSAETLQVESIIKSDGPIHTTNGVEIKPGVEVQSLYSGAYGKVDSYTPGETFAVINAEDPEGLKPSVKVVVDVKFLKAVGGSLPAQTAPNLAAPPKEQPKAKPSVDPSYVGKLYPDGSQPKLGQIVVAGSGSKEMTGEVVGFNKENTYVKVKGPDGVKWRAIGQVSSVVSQPDAKETKLAAQPDVVQVEANAFVPEAEIGIPGTEVPVAFGDDLTLYETVPQTAADKKKWLDGNPKRQLMKGGLAPAIGMPVRVDDGTPMIITGMPKSDSASVILYDPATGKTVSRGAQKLTLDAKKYFGSEGLVSRNLTFKSVDNEGNVKVDTIQVPHGSIVYKVKASTRGYGDTYYFLAPDGTVYQNDVAQNGAIVKVFNNYGYDKARREWMISHLFGAEKIGIASDLGEKEIISQLHKNWWVNDKTGEVTNWQPYGPNKGDWTQQTQEGFSTLELPKTTAVAAVNEAFAKSKVVSVTPSSTKKYEPPKPVKATPGALAKPNIPDADEDVLPGTSPLVTGEGTPDMLSQIPAVVKKNPNAKSAKDAISDVLDGRGKTDASSGVRYSLADGDTVEDMQIRFQIVRDANGDEYMEARFKLLEDKSEELFDGLTAAKGEKGGWKQTGTVTPVELKEGDSISVRRSTSGLLKPANGDAPNAVVTGTPVLVGKADASGYSLYRVGVIMGDGEYAEMDVELRDSASIGVFNWDKNKVISSNGKVELTPAAQADGWTRTPGLWLPITTGKVQVDKTGVQEIKASNDMGTNVGSGDRGSTLTRTLADGTKIRVMGAGSNEGGTSHSASDVRRNSFAGDVRVRVPLPKGKSDMDEVLKSMSKGLEAAGLPVEKQEPPDPQQMVKLALNKLYKTHAAKFEHRGQFGQASGLPGDPATEKMLADISKRVGLSKEPLTLDDLVFSADSDGRLTVRLSDRAADAITKQQGNRFYTHSLSGNANERVIEMLSGSTATGLMATEERWSMGIGTTGMSSSTDVSYGSGNGVYATGRTGSKLSAGSNTVIFSPRALNSSLEVYTNAGDGYGRRSASNTFATSGGNHEYMFKSRLSRDQIAYVTVPDPKFVIAELKKRGVTEINGRPIEDIVRSSTSLNGVNITDPSFTNLGVLDHIATAGDLAAAAPAAGMTGPA